MNKIAYVILMLTTSLYAQSKVGSSAAAFLGSGVGSRAIGMGGAFSAVGGDASILYWNPGAMANIKKSEVLLSKANWLVESDLNYIASIIKLEKGRSFGGYLMQLDYYKGHKLYLFEGKEFLLLFYLSQIIFHTLIYQGFEGDIISQKQSK